MNDVVNYLALKEQCHISFSNNMYRVVDYIGLKFPILPQPCCLKWTKG